MVCCSRADHSSLGQKVDHTGEVGQQVGRMAAVDHIAVEDREVGHAVVGEGHLGDHTAGADEMGVGCIAGLGQKKGTAAGV